MQTPLHARLAGGALTFAGDGFTPRFCSDGDFWRLHLDFGQNGLSRELGVYSHAQTPTALTEDGGKLTVVYDDLVAENGLRYPIRLTLTVTEADDGALLFAATVDNTSEARVNELQYPLLEVEQLAGALADDVLYVPRGLGARIPNPHKVSRWSHTEYMAADYKNIWSLSTYPGQMSMPWFGVQSGGHFLALSRRDEVCRITGFATGTEPREADEQRFLMTVCAYPAVLPGECLTLDGYRLAAYAGDWREEADSYRAHADATFLADDPIPRKASAKQLLGWQRIILKHQYGEIFHTYAELPRLWREGVKYGLNMLLLFAWWKEGMDNGYPNYQPDEALGGADALRAAIAEIEAEGGRVILYANGHIIDASTEYYQTEGKHLTMKNIEGMEYREFYKFSNNGTMLRFGGHKTFVLGCHGTPAWRDKIAELAERKLSLGSHGVFFDQLCVGFNLCFDTEHEHGPRIDTEPQHRLDTIRRIRAGLGRDDWFGSECMLDRITPLLDFTHGFGPGTFFREDTYPYLFRYTFPEALISNRLSHDEKPGFLRELNYAFVHGLLYDVGLWRCRAKCIEDFPAYAERVGQLSALRQANLEVFTEGRYDLPPDDLPQGLYGASYRLGARTVLALFNDGKTDIRYRDTLIPAGEVAMIDQ